ncbi:MAG: AAA family ATPase [Firmicutes bacterium]|nr:AAA family ATPase [Bacillota bacterium]
MRELQRNELYSRPSPDSLGFATTAELEPFDGLIGQERAAAALKFGLNVKMRGYNIFVCGSAGTGRTSFARKFALDAAASEPTPRDLCYIYNFENPKCPKLLTLPPGEGKIFRDKMDELINLLQNELPKLFGNKDFESRKAELVKVYQDHRDIIIKGMTEEAKENSFGVKSTNSGIYFMPIVEGEVINEEQFEALSQDVKDQISSRSEVVQKRAAEAMREIREYEKKTRRDVEELEYSVGLFAVGRRVNAIMDDYADSPEVLAYLLSVKEDILDHIADFVIEESEEDEGFAAYLPWYGKKNPEEMFTKYKVNVMTDNAPGSGAPVIMDFNPTYSNLVGEIEYDNEFGNFSTDFMKIKPGLLHRANGGYLIVQAHDVLSNYHAWETIRRVLLTGEITTEPMREFTTGVAVSGVKPQPVKMDVKIIMIGTGYFYDLLYEFDDDFEKLFKIRADFDYEMKNSGDNVYRLCRFVKNFVVRERAPEFDAAALVRIIELSERLAERKDRLSSKFNRISEILKEASVWAQMDGAGVVSEPHVMKAISQREYRLNMYEEKLSEMIEEGLIMIDTSGQKVGQINGLAVIDMDDFVFAKPSRITATTYVGKAGIINIEKEAEMSGSIHDKGVQVLTGYLGQTYAQDFPLSMSCRICFEQNYSGIDGDSASSAELYAVLSSLAQLPINQEIAVTGSINQRGEIQPIGGVSYKIEGFFDLCKKRGLSGGQGVIIPSRNERDLVLRDEVVDAVRDGLFHIYSIERVDEGIELLTGVPAGERSDKGRYPVDSVHGKVMRRLKEFYNKSLDD